jgi:monofunctional biosynthetic peptidoglycan transglycosylase
VRLLRLVVRRLAITVVSLYLAAVVGLVYLRFLPPLLTMVQLQRFVEAVAGPERVRHRASWVSLRSLPAHVPRSVVAAEDARFYQHRGFDWTEVKHAVEENLEGERRRGASTLTQQLMKNLYLTTHRSFVRKGAEIALTPAAELVLPKARILELYMNVVEWGPGVYGIEAAAQHHYRIPARRLTRDQAARLAAILPAPRSRKPARMTGYASVIRQRMAQMGW